MRKTRVKKMISRPTKTAKKRLQAELVKEYAANRKKLWTAYKVMQKRVDEAWAKLRANAKKKAHPSLLIRDKNELLLLLGECNYMARECMEMKKRES